MNIRPFQLPHDIDLMASLLMEGFQYPDNPEWNVQEDEKQGMIDQIKSAKRLWPIMRVMRIFSPLFRDLICGFISEEENKPTGLINYMRQRNEPEWHIGNVTVLPAYRRRGIARKLVETTLDELRNREAKIAFLEVVVGNEPAFKLYKEVGFEAFSQSSEYDCQNDIPVVLHPLPEGYTLKPLGMFDWKTRFTLAKRITPEHIIRYQPVIESRYRIPFIMQILRKLFESTGGFQRERFAIYDSHGKIVGVGYYNYRTRAGGTNSITVSVDPSHAGVAEFILSYALSSIQKVSLGHRIELGLEDWQSSLVQATEAQGLQKRLSLNHMGLRF